YGGSQGGGIASSGNLTLDSAVVQNSHSTYEGGGLRSWSGDLNIIDTTFRGNSSQMGGGFMRTVSGTNSTRIEGSTITDNEAYALGANRGVGGGIRIVGNGTGQVEIIGSTVSANRGVKGGGMDLRDSVPILIVNSTFTDNEAKVIGYNSGVTAGGIT